MRAIASCCKWSTKGLPQSMSLKLTRWSGDCSWQTHQKRHYSPPPKCYSLMFQWWSAHIDRSPNHHLDTLERFVSVLLWLVVIWPGLILLLISFLCLMHFTGSTYGGRAVLCNAEGWNTWYQQHETMYPWLHISPGSIRFCSTWLEASITSTRQCQKTGGEACRTIWWLDRVGECSQYSTVQMPLVPCSLPIW